MLEKIGLPPKPSLKGNNWVVDATHCQGCSSQFTFIHRKHHCRRCGGIFCSSCTQLRMVLRGQGDSPVRICEPCKKLEEAARFEMRHGHKNRAGRGGPKLTPKYEDEVLNKILGNDEQEFASFGHESNIKMLSSSQRSSSSASCSNIQEAITHDEGGEILRSLSVGVTEIGSTTLSTPDELRQQALDEKKKYKTLKAEGKSEEALRAFKRGKELERQAGALDLQLRKSRRMASSSMNMNEISKTKDGTGESRKINKFSPEITKDKDDLAAELKNLGWSDLELRDADKKPVSMSLDGELSSLLGEVSQKTNTKKVAHGSDKSQVIALKKNALALKREGKLAEAKEELKRAKILEKQIEEQEFLVDADDSDDSDEELSSLIRSMDSHKQNDFSFGDVPDTNFNFDNLVDIADGLVDNFEVTDEDMDDPEMTAALESLGWTEDTRDTADNESQSVPVNREILLAEIQSLKREALNQKRAGNTAEALTLLKKAKVIEGDLGSYDSLGTNLNAHGSTIVQKDSLLQPAGILKPNLVDARKPDERKDANPILTPKSKLMIQRELLALKKRALALRREGKLDEADEELKKGKALEQQLEEMDQTSKVKVTQVNNSFKDATTSAVLDVGDEEEDVTEQDMHDPSYTSLLRNLGWMDEENGNVQSPPKENVNTPIIASDSSVTYVHTGIQLGASRRSKGEIQRELLGLKRKSLALRRQGEAEEAEEVLKMAKVLEAQLSEMEAPKQEVPAEVNELQKDESSQSSVKIDADDEGAAGFSVEDNTPRPSQKRSSTEDLGRVDKVTSEKRDKIDRENVNYSIDESNSTQVMVSQNNQSSPQQELLAHKRRAVTLKREGKLVEAKEELRQAKLLERSLEDNNPKPSTSSSDVSSSNNASIQQKEHSSISAPKLSSRDRFKLQQESLSHKRQALKLRREGRTAEAEAEFELAKALETQLEELTANDPNKLSGNSAEPIDDAGVEDFLDPQLLSALKAIGIDDSPNVSGGAKRPEPVKSIAVKIDNSGEDRTQLEDRIKAEKVKAVNLKRLGKQAEAMDALRRAKMLEKKLNSLAS